MTSVSDQPWLNAASTRAVMSALEAAGGQGCARFVGGCVRNALMGEPVGDIDIATKLKPEDVSRALVAAGLKAIPTGVAHGTVTAVAAGAPFEITTLRRDVSTDGRNATVAFTDDWSADAARRDFRLNALYADAGGQVFDPTGRGLADAAARRIVFVGDPETRIAEDFLRILRFFRFRAWYGRGEPDPAALAACRSLAEGMSRLSAERVSKELMKLLAAPDPSRAVDDMAEAGVLARILPEGRVSTTFGEMVRRVDDPELRLMALLPPDASLTRAASARLRLPSAVRNRLAAAAEVHSSISPAMSDARLRAVVYRHGARATVDALRRLQAEDPGRADQVERLVRHAESWSPPRLPVGGRDVAKRGIDPGPETGRLLKAFEESWIADDFPTTGHDDRLSRLIAASRA